MSKELERMKEIETRKEELRKEIAEGKADEVRLAAIKEEAENLAKEQAELRTRMAIDDQLVAIPVPEQRNSKALSAEKFCKENRMTIPMFKEERALLVSSGKLATPTAVSTEIGQLPDVVSSIVDDVDCKDATGTGSWKFPYKTANATAADHTEGQAYGGTGATYDIVTIGPSEWGVLDEVSNQVRKQSPVNYAADVQNSAYLALRKKAKEKITAAVMASSLTTKRTGVVMDATYVRNVVLGFNGDESVAGGTKMYLCKEDLQKIGAIRGTQEKKAVFEITFKDENNGQIKDGGTVIPFSINSSVPAGTQLYGQPKSIKMLLWGDYEVSTDDGGEYFKKGLLGVRGDCTGNADLTVLGGMQIIKQASE